MNTWRSTGFWVGVSRARVEGRTVVPKTAVSDCLARRRAGTARPTCGQECPPCFADAFSRPQPQPSTSTAEKAARAPRLRRARGFTLIEVVVALMMFSVAVVVLAASYVNILNSIEAVRVDQSLEQELAFVRAQLLLEPELDRVEEGGEVPTPTHGMALWEATVSPTYIADLFRVDLTIDLAGDRKAVPSRTVHETLFLLRSSWSEPTEREDLRNESRKRIEELRRMRPL